MFDIGSRGPSVTRHHLLTVKIWIRRQQAWTLLLEEAVDLRALNFIGTLRDQIFPPNTLIFHLVDGVYSLEIPSRQPPPKQGLALPTSSYNSLMKLATLDNSIQDALVTQARITAQINAIIDNTPADVSPQALNRVELANKYVSQQRRALGSAEKRREQLRESIAARRKAIETGRELQERAGLDVANATDKLESSKQLVAQTKEQIHGQRRRICADLADIFPITPTTAGSLSFQICGIPLPNTDDSLTPRAEEDPLSAALGHVALLTSNIQYYLSVPLPYPLTHLGSRSLVTDPISNLSDSGGASRPQRDFPLYLPRGGSGSAADFRFKYAWFLLNKDIEALCASQGLKVVDIRHTLPNLKYLLYVASAGRDEVPERKRGGVRGLWADRLKNRIAADDRVAADGVRSRSGSTESEVLSRQRDELRKALSGHQAAETAFHDQSPFPAVGLPFDEEGTRLTLRTKGLRENVGR